MSPLIFSDQPYLINLFGLSALPVPVDPGLALTNKRSKEQRRKQERKQMIEIVSLRYTLGEIFSLSVPLFSDLCPPPMFLSFFFFNFFLDFSSDFPLLP